MGGEEGTQGCIRFGGGGGGVVDRLFKILGATTEAIGADRHERQ